MTTEELIKYYSALLIAQYQPLPKARAMVEALVGELVADSIILKFRDAFNLSSAVGVQLDIIGRLIGVSREFHGAPIDKNFFVLAPYADWAAGEPTTWTEGFYFYNGVRVFHGLRTYHDVLSPVYSLSDIDYRRMLKYVAELNTLDYSMTSIHKVVLDNFGLVLRESSRVPGQYGWLPVVDIYDASELYHSTLNPPAMDNMAMEYSYRFTDATEGDAFITAAVYEGLFPRPAGVLVTISSVDSN